MPNDIDLFIYGPIGSGEGEFSAADLRTRLKELPEDINMIRAHLYSIGGDAGEGLSIADILKGHKAKIEMIIEGLAASAASIVAMAGDAIKIFDNALMILHKPYASLIGNAEDHRSAAVVLDAVQRAMVTTYRWHSWMIPTAIDEMINKTTWLSAEEAKDKGFATEIIKSVPVTASLQPPFDPKLLSRLGPIPTKHRETVEAMIVARRQRGLSHNDIYRQRREGTRSSDKG